MKKFVSTLLMASVLIPAMADVTVKVPTGEVAAKFQALNYDYTPIANIVKAKKRSELGTVSEKAAFNGTTATVPVGQDMGGYQFKILFGETPVQFYAAPGDEILIDVTSVEPLQYNISGTPLIEAANEYNAIGKSYKDQILELQKAETPDRQKMQGIYNDYIETIKDFIEENPTSITSAVAVRDLSGEDYVNAYNHLGERAKSTIITPLLDKQLESVQKSLEKERKLQALQAGDVDAPAFTLKDLDGKDVSLSDFKGKWVILDFWGSWCPWCIKGFPELKEAYAKYKDILEIVGIDCRESEDAWRAGVAKYELPWVNVYNPTTTTLLDEYAVSGFPTKAIVNPEGKIANITVGHDPEFFVKLTELIGK